MTPIAHLLTSWIIATKTTNNVRDVRLVTLAGILPDADGFGLVVDLIKDPSLQQSAFYYQKYHHWLAHGIVGGLVISLILACFARQRGRVFLFCLLAFHVHLLCDFVGSRGPTPQDLWPIFYLGPITYNPMWSWAHQWQLDGWQNRMIAVSLFFWALWLAAKRGDSVVGVFNRRLDRVVVEILQKWKSDVSKMLSKSQTKDATPLV